MLSKNHPVILFIDRFGFGAYQDTLVNIPRFNFTPDLVSNLDVINKEQFGSLVATFIQINKIVPSSLAVILSDDIIYIKDLANLTQKPAPVQDPKTDEVQNFLEDVPFEEVLAKVIKTGNVNRIVAVNKDLVMTIIDTFVSKGFAIDTITPGFMYGQSANFTAGLNLDNIHVILGNTEILRLGNLLTDQEKMITSQNLESELKNPLTNTKPGLADEAKKPQSRRQYILIGVLVVLLVILAIIYFTIGVSKTPPVKRINNPANGIGVPAVPQGGGPASIRESTTIVPIDLKTISIKISHSVSSSGIAVNLKNSLTGIGFQNMLDEISEVSVPEKSSVIFSQNIPADLRSSVIVEIRKILTEVSILENQELNSAINILIGRS